MKLPLKPLLLQSWLLLVLKHDEQSVNHLKKSIEKYVNLRTEITSAWPTTGDAANEYVYQTILYQQRE